MNNNLFDVALSFAGEDRAYVEKVAEGLRARNIRVFYDKYETASLWGKNLYDHLADVYQNQSRFTILFISRFYANKVWTNHERQNAQARALNENREYILPARFDDTEVPGLTRSTGFIDLRITKPAQLVELIVEKISEIPGSQSTLQSSVVPQKTGLLNRVTVLLEKHNIKFIYYFIVLVILIAVGYIVSEMPNINYVRIIDKTNKPTTLTDNSRNLPVINPAIDKNTVDSTLGGSIEEIKQPDLYNKQKMLTSSKSSWLFILAAFGITLLIGSFFVEAITGIPEAHEYANFGEGLSVGYFFRFMSAIEGFKGIGIIFTLFGSITNNYINKLNSYYFSYFIGFIAAAFGFILYKSVKLFLKKIQASGDIEILKVGQLALVSEEIPPKGLGIVRVTLNGNYQWRTARLDQNETRKAFIYSNVEITEINKVLTVRII